MSHPSTRQAFLSRIEAFLSRSGMSEREFGLQAIGSHKLVPRLRQGLATLKSIERAEAFMDEHDRRDRSEAAA